ncbi:hypothetical protein AB0K05_09195 [Nonomuraea sp. NPDC049486]|uniref:hypothetical protein n=1 Tax=Nonomuraea sp. NPDC049486 TaxID=3155773 RepID=UPI003448B6AE
MNELQGLARVRDEDLAGRSTGPAARALFDAILTAEPPSPARTRRPRRRLVLGLAVAAAFTSALVVGPTLVAGPHGATSYANAAMHIELRDGLWVARVKDPHADWALYEEAFRAVGVDVTLEIVPAAPDHVGHHLGGGRSGMTSGGPNTLVTGIEPDGCLIGEEGCHLVIKVDENLSGRAYIRLGRAAKPGEVYKSHGTATKAGGMLSGFRVDERPVSVVRKEAERRGLQVVYQIIEPNPDGQGFGLDPDDQSLPVGDDWIVWDAEPHADGVVRLIVSEERVPLNPLYGGPKPRELTSGR